MATSSALVNTTTSPPEATAGPSSASSSTEGTYRFASASAPANEARNQGPHGTATPKRKLRVNLSASPA
eukprot:12919830-Prorocentrum_lima.AAC.1